MAPQNGSLSTPIYYLVSTGSHGTTKIFTLNLKAWTEQKRKHLFTSNCRKMNEADKERYFREKEAYERITGHVLPVAKVRKKRMDLVILIYSFQVVISNPTSNSASQDSTGATRSAFVDLVRLCCSLKKHPIRCIRAGCNRPSIRNAEWEDEYCW